MGDLDALLVARRGEVPIARYGDSYQGRVKYIYRHGLLVRYGGMMQAISGVHFNYSLPEPFWPLYAEICQCRDSGQDFVSARYFDLLRNYRRHGWLVSLSVRRLAGAVPLIPAGPRAIRSCSRWAPSTLIGPHATSLRMSDIGYRNRNQAAVAVSVNRLEQYLRDLRRAVNQPHPPFEALGVKVDGEYRQLSGNVLQIENEYYSYVRPKRTLRAGERTIHALARAGVEYVEVRALDNSAFDPVGVNPRKLYFLEAFCSCCCSRTARRSTATKRRRSTAITSRSPAMAASRGLMLERDGRSVPMRDLGRRAARVDAGHVRVARCHASAAAL